MLTGRINESVVCRLTFDRTGGADLKNLTQISASVNNAIDGQPVLSRCIRFVTHPSQLSTLAEGSPPPTGTVPNARSRFLEADTTMPTEETYMIFTSRY